MFDVRPIVHIIGIVGCAMAFVMLVPMVADIYVDNDDWQNFAISAITVAFISMVSVLSTRNNEPFHLTLKQAFLVTASGWLATSLIGSLPFLGLGHGFADSVFESVSGITTTGSTVFSELDYAPPGMLLWRAILQWVGGIGIIVMAILIMPFLRVGGMQLFKIESSEISEKIDPSAYRTVRNIIFLYGALTFLCALLFFAFGMTPFDAICHAMATLSTGGYSTHDASFGFFKDNWLYWIATIFMLLGAMPFFLYIKTLRGHPKALLNDQQVRGFISVVVLTTVILSMWLFETRGTSYFDALTISAFNIVSVITTTGFATEDYTLWGTGAIGFFLVLTFVGGCSGSTSGAIKIYRFQVLSLVTKTYIKRLVSPNRVIVTRYNGKTLPEDVPFSILAFLVVFVATIAGVTVILTFLGLDIVTAYSASVTAITNVGPGLGDIVGPAGNFATLPGLAKWVLAFAMLMGRLEVFALLVFFDRDFWKP